MNTKPVIIDVGHIPSSKIIGDVLERREKAVIDSDGRTTVKTFVRVPSNNYGTGIFLAFAYIFAVVIAAHGGAFSFITTFMGGGEF